MENPKKTSTKKTSTKKASTKKASAKKASAKKASAKKASAPELVQQPSKLMAQRRQRIFNDLLSNLMAFKGDPSNVTIDASAPLVVQIHKKIAPLLDSWGDDEVVPAFKVPEEMLLEVNALLATKNVEPLKLDELTALALLMRGGAFRPLAPYWSSDVRNVAGKQEFLIW